MKEIRVLEEKEETLSNYSVVYKWNLSTSIYSEKSHLCQAYEFFEITSDE